LQAQLKLPGELVQMAFELQLLVPFVHSFTSAHVDGWFVVSQL
jgi:hypothetical protein